MRNCVIFLLIFLLILIGDPVFAQENIFPENLDETMSMVENEDISPKKITQNEFGKHQENKNVEDQNYHKDFFEDNISKEVSSNVGDEEKNKSDKSNIVINDSGKSVDEINTERDLKIEELELETDLNQDEENLESNKDIINYDEINYENISETIEISDEIKVDKNDKETEPNEIKDLLTEDKNESTDLMDSNEDLDVDRFSELLEKIENSENNKKTEIELLPGKYIFEESLIISSNKEIVLTKNDDLSEEVIFKRSENLSNPMIKVNEGGKLILNGHIIFDGEDKDLSNEYSYHSLALEINGNAIIDGAEIRNFKNNSENTYVRSLIKVSGTKENRAKLNISDISIHDNELNGMYNEKIDMSYYAYIMYLKEFSDVVMNGGTIYNNKTSNGTIQVGSSRGKDLSNSEVEYSVTFTLNDGEISNNNTLSKGNYGGGVTVYRSSKFVMNGGKISENEADYGGGIHVDSRFIEETDSENYAKTRDESKDEYYEKYPIKFVMNGGVIYGNRARRSGGGIYINSDGVEINKGKIINNSAKIHGGGIYVSMTPIHFEIKNAFITENEAKILEPDINEYYQGNGGGFWGCPTSQFYFNVKDGNIIYNNKSDNKGSDIYTTGKTNKFTVNGEDVSEGLLTVIKPVDRYKREIVLESQNENTDLITTDEVAYKLYFDEKSLEEAENLPVLIKGNTAKRGGGIGTNAALDSGERGKFELDVKKLWYNDISKKEKIMNPEKVKVSLYYKDELVDILNIDSSKTYTFTNLINDPNENINDYKLVEEDISGYKSEVNVFLKSEYFDNFEGKDGYLYVVENTKVGDLIISKVVLGQEGSDDEFSFSISLHHGENNELENLFYYIISNELEILKEGKIKSGETFQLSDGQSIQIKEVPFGTGYVITEQKLKDYVVASEGEVGIVNNEEMLVSFTNTKIPNKPDEPDEPDEPPEEPDEPPEEPDEPDEPDEPPEEPDEPDEPDEPPEEPDEPDEPDNPPETPDKPERPKTPPEEPEIPEEPEEPPTPPEEPEIPEEPEEPEEPPVEPEEPESPPEEPYNPKAAPKTFDQGIRIYILIGLLSVIGFILLEKEYS